MPVLRGLRRWAAELENEVHALYIAYRDPRVPLYARAFTALVVVYALSPLDLIPDPIPVLGYLDDLVLIPLGLAIARRLIPPEVMERSRQKARDREGRPVVRGAVAAVVVAWVLISVAGGWIALRVVA